MSRVKGKYFSGLGNVAFTVAGGLTALAILGFFLFSWLGADFLNKEVGLSESDRALPSSELNQDNKKQSLAARILPPAKFSPKAKINFDAAKPSVAPTASLAPVGEGFFQNQNSDETEEISAGPLIKIVISEILFGTKSSSREEFVELYNPNDFNVDLTGWELRKKTESGADSVLVAPQKFSGQIRPRSYFVISHPDFSQGLDGNLAWSSKSYSISENNAIYLFDNFSRQIDLVGCGSAFDYETAACLVPETGISVSRPGNLDTDNNRKDLSFSTPSPRKVFAVYSSLPLPSQSLAPAVSFAVSPALTPSPSPATSSPLPSASPNLVPSPEPIFSPSPEPNPELLPLQIIEVQYGLQDNANSDFVKISNPNQSAVVLKGYKLVKKVAASGKEYALNYEWTESDQVPANSDFYWVSSKYPEKAAELKGLGLTVFIGLKDLTITDTNGIALKFSDQIVSSVNW